MEKVARLKENILNRIAGITIKEWILKAISLCLAIFLWYFIVGEEQVDITITVPIEIINLPANLIISHQYKKNIEVTVRGPRSLVQELRTKNITRPVNLSDVSPGTLIITNERDSISFPGGISVLRLQPTNTTLFIDELIQQKIPVKPILEGKPSAGYRVTDVSVQPDRLNITGPLSILDDHSALKTYTINLDGLDRSTTIPVQLHLNPELIDLIGEPVVLVTITVQEKMIKKTVTGIPVNVHNAHIPVKTIPSTIKVEASIPENLFRDTPEPAMLFRASARPEGDDFPQEVKVMVSGITVPNHAPLEVLAIHPEKVQLVPEMDNSNDKDTKKEN